MDDIEGSWNQPMTGREVAVWCVDLIEESLESPERTVRGEALLARLASVAQSEDDLKLLLWQFAQASAMLAQEMRFFIDTDAMLSYNVDGDEKLRRALLATKMCFASAGKEARSPWSPSAEG
jgi:hypothetical protein